MILSDAAHISTAKLYMRAPKLYIFCMMFSKITFRMPKFTYQNFLPFLLCYIQLRKKKDR